MNHKSCSNLHNSCNNTIIIYVYVLYIIMITQKELQAFHFRKKIRKKNKWPTEFKNGRFFLFPNFKFINFIIKS